MSPGTEWWPQSSSTGPGQNPPILRLKSRCQPNWVLTGCSQVGSLPSSFSLWGGFNPLWLVPKNVFPCGLFFGSHSAHRGCPMAPFIFTANIGESLSCRIFLMLWISDFRKRPVLFKGSADYFRLIPDNLLF